MINEYWRSRLCDKAQKCYDILLDGAKVRADRISCRFTKEKHVQEAYFALVEDHPELFYLANEYSSKYFRLGPPGLSVDDVTVDMIYLYSDVQILKAQKEIDGHINALRQRTKGMDDRQKVIEAVEYVVGLTSYEIDNEYNQNAAAALYSKKAQCSGISKAVKLLLDSIDVPCITAFGQANDGNGEYGPHAWCIVTINGHSYHVDPTFMLGINASKRTPYTRCWLFYDDNTLSRTHTWERGLLPACDDSSLKINNFRFSYVPQVGDVFRSLTSRFGEKKQIERRTVKSPTFTNLREFREYLKKQFCAREEIIACELLIPTPTFDVFRQYVNSAVEMVQKDMKLERSISVECRGDGTVTLRIDYDG